MPVVLDLVVREGVSVMLDTVEVVFLDDGLVVLLLVELLLSLGQHDGQDSHVLDGSRLLETVPHHSCVVTELVPGIGISGCCCRVFKEIDCFGGGSFTFCYVVL